MFLSSLNFLLHRYLLLLSPALFIHLHSSLCFPFYHFPPLNRRQNCTILPFHSFTHSYHSLFRLSVLLFCIIFYSPLRHLTSSIYLTLSLFITFLTSEQETKSPCLPISYSSFLQPFSSHIIPPFIFISHVFPFTLPNTRIASKEERGSVGGKVGGREGGSRNLSPFPSYIFKAPCLTPPLLSFFHLI